MLSRTALRPMRLLSMSGGNNRNINSPSRSRRPPLELNSSFKMAHQQYPQDVTTFRYQALRPDKQEIRLMHIENLDTDMSSLESGAQPLVRCRLQHASLTDKPHYTALSYAWGDPSIKRDILLDGQQVQVTQNLEAALRHIAEECPKDGGQTVSLWVDAVCIDQQNEVERTQQVSQMDVIFRTAAETIVWLGSVSEDSDLAIDTLRGLSRIAPSISTYFASWSHVPFGTGDSNLVVRGIEQRLDEALLALRLDDSARLTSIGSLFERSWFQRVWVIQERVLSANCIICCGKEWITWQMFYEGFWLLCGLRDYLILAGTGRQNSSALAAFLTAALDRVTPVAFTSAGSSLLQLLSLLSRMTPRPQTKLQASDQRDYVYALLGLVHPHHSPPVLVDYSKDWATVQTEVATACLRYYGPNVLSFADHSISNEISSQPRAPSWAPDWSSNHLPQPLHLPSIFVARGGNRRRAYSAAKGYTQTLSGGFTTRGQLCLKALYVDEVTQLGMTVSDADHAADDTALVASLRIWLQHLERLVPGTTEAYGTAKKVHDALWRTPIADRAFVHNWETARASKETYSAYHAVQTGDVALGVKYANIAYNKLFRRRPLRSTKGYIGLGPLGVRKGDSIWVLPGADVPFIFRPAENGTFMVIGEAYIHGIMDGELVKRGLMVGHCMISLI